jgi:hypothetical protein
MSDQTRMKLFVGPIAQCGAAQLPAGAFCQCRLIVQGVQLNYTGRTD